MSNFKKILLALTLVLGTVSITTIISQPELIDAKSENNIYHFNSKLNENIMKKLPNYAVNSAMEKFNTDKLNKDNTMIQMTLKLTDGNNEEYKGKANGAFKIDERAYGFEFSGPVKGVTNPETKQTYYYGHLTGEVKGVNVNKNQSTYEAIDGQNGGFIIVFNAENPETEFYIASTVGFEENGGTTIYGDFNVHMKWEEAVEASGGVINWN
ncbi:hypothetical protein [Chengkuizengella sediminis]|uniref:hypothetical protein n=1 Tax=Chengkuizengella sediminis TaxID=1885917 RepID=UPI0013899DC0|nr:hypothetical protein [Chengkuizengella sediminis]NDI36352.1 hypothetical protein [Chengkuizengella sediminis]